MMANQSSPHTTPDHDENVRYIVGQLDRLTSEYVDFRVRHGMAHKPPHRYTDCVVIRWHRSKSQRRDHGRITYYSRLVEQLCRDHGLIDPRFPLCDRDLLLHKIGISSMTHGSFTYIRVWAIPNQYSETIQVEYDVDDWDRCDEGGWWSDEYDHE
jgi:hypothetical protein